jgi:hypothetical protein
MKEKRISDMATFAEEYSPEERARGFAAWIKDNPNWTHAPEIEDLERYYEAETKKTPRLWPPPSQEISPSVFRGR